MILDLIEEDKDEEMCIAAARALPVGGLGQ